MSIIRLSIRSLTLPKDKSLISVDYKISNDGTFSGDDVIIDIEKDSVNLTGREFDLDFTTHDIYYGKIRLNFNSTGTDYYEGRPVVITKNGDGFSHNNSVIVTPYVTINKDIKNSPLGNFTITASDFVLFSGVGNHKYTSWYIRDSKGDVKWKREKDKNNLTSIRIPNNTLEANKHYSIEVIYISDSNQTSNKGKLLIKTVNDSILSNLTTYDNSIMTVDECIELQDNYEELLEIIVNNLALGVECVI